MMFRNDRFDSEPDGDPYEEARIRTIDEDYAYEHARQARVEQDWLKGGDDEQRVLAG